MDNKFLTDNAGNPSMMRLGSMIALAASVGFGALTLLRGSPDGLYVTAMFLIAAFCPKTLQKFVETQMPEKK